MAFLLYDDPTQNESAPDAETLDRYESLRLKVTEWLGGSMSPADLGLSRSELEVVEYALLIAPLYEIKASQLSDLEERLRALRKLYKRKGSEKGARAVVKALGWSKGKRGDSYPNEDVWDDYVWLIGEEPRVGARCIRSPTRSDGSPLYPSRDVSRPEAIRLLKDVYEFPSLTACRESLLKSNRRLKALYGGEPGPPGSRAYGFTIPDSSQLKEPA